MTGGRCWQELRPTWTTQADIGLKTALMTRRVDCSCFSAMDGVSRFQDLVAWQLASALKEKTDAICQRAAARRDFKFHDQLMDAAASGPRNLAEGFGRFYHREFAQFARIAKASELEVLNHLIDAKCRGYINTVEHDDADHACRRALQAVNGLIRYLESTPDFGRE